MAKSGFVHNQQGYLSVLNGSDAYGACDRAGATTAAKAGRGYAYDTRRGQTRIHTRVKAANKASSRRLKQAADSAGSARW